jgi:hypothetical protein
VCYSDATIYTKHALSHGLAARHSNNIASLNIA